MTSNSTVQNGTEMQNNGQKTVVMKDVYFIDILVHIGDLENNVKYASFSQNSTEEWMRIFPLHGQHIKCKKLFFNRPNCISLKQRWVEPRTLITPASKQNSCCHIKMLWAKMSGISWPLPKKL